MNCQIVSGTSGKEGASPGAVFRHVFAEEAVELPVARAEPFDFAPVACGVVEFDPVGELMDDHIVDDRLGPADEPPGEIQPAVPAAGAPASAGAADPDMAASETFGSSSSAASFR